MSGLAGLAGVAVSNAVLRLGRSWRRDDVLVVLLVVAAQALLWWWVHSRDRPLWDAAALLARRHPLLVAWMVAELALLAALWTLGPAGAPWRMLAAYGQARAAALALAALALAWKGKRWSLAAGLPRGLMLGAALAAPALGAFLDASPLWQIACAGGVLSLTAAALSVTPGGAGEGLRRTWLGLAGVVAWPAAALGLAGLFLGGISLTWAGPIALTSLLPALGLATVAVRAAADTTDPD
jgi:hypothetical protein